MDKVMVAALMEIDLHPLEGFILKKMGRLLREEHGLFDGKNGGSLVFKILSGSTFMHKKRADFQKSAPFTWDHSRKGTTALPWGMILMV